MISSSDRIKVSIVDDSSSYRDSLRKILEEDKRLYVYSEYDLGSAFIKSLDSPFKPDVCLIDVVLKDISGIECARRAKEAIPSIRIVIMTAYPDADSFSQARKIGADYVEKGQRLEALLDQIITTSLSGQEENLISLRNNGRLKISHIDLINELDALEERASELSGNQIRVIKLKKSGKSIKEIARIMNIESGTVHTHLKRALKKLQIPDVLDYIID